MTSSNVLHSRVRNFVEEVALPALKGVTQGEWLSMQVSCWCLLAHIQAAVVSELAKLPEHLAEAADECWTETTSFRYAFIPLSHVQVMTYRDE